MTLSTAVVISTYNGHKYIEEQLDSIRLQTKAPDEVVIVDDCSTDETVTIVQNYIQKYQLSRWKVCVNKVNKGWEKNFIDGMAQANSDLIFPCDQDDFWHPNKIALMSDIMAKNSNINVLVSNYRKIFNETGHPALPKTETAVVTSPIKVRPTFMRVDYPGCVYCVRRSFFQSIVPYWFAKCPHDALLWRMAMFSDGLSVVNQELIDWRQHSDSSFKLQNKNKDYQYQLDYLKYDKKVTLSLTKFIHDTTNYSLYLNLLQRHLHLIAVRDRFYQTKNPLLIIKLLMNIKTYPRKRTILRDIYTVYCCSNRF